MEKETYQVKIAGGRRIVLPGEACEKLNVKVGDTVVVDVQGDEIRIRSWQTVLHEIQELVARYIPPGVSLVDELIAERRAEAKRERAERE